MAFDLLSRKVIKFSELSGLFCGRLEDKRILRDIQTMEICLVKFQREAKILSV